MARFGEVYNDFTLLYNSGNYALALELVTAELPNHKDYAAILMCFRIAMLSRLGDVNSAIVELRAALNAGYWYHEGALHGDPDFAALQGNPEFEQLVEQNAVRRKQAIENIKPVLRVLEPKTYPAPLLIAIHGNFSNVDTFADYWKAAQDMGWLVALPQSLQPSWLSGFYDQGDVEAASHEITRHYQQLLSHYNIDTTRIITAGFSRGALIAERIALTQQLPASGFCWIECSLDENLEQILQNAPTGVRAYLVAGQGQDFIPAADALHQQLTAHGIVSTVEYTPNEAHELSVDFPQVLEKAIQFICP
jgi:predicted esterase